ncbi:MAG: DUF3530 family protein [Methylophaga sp.]|nr:DUF3530 family protein [Methylophaga sp.]
MIRFQTIWLSLVFIVFLPLSLLAADEDKQTEDTEVVAAESASRMLRQISTVTGYQPLTVAGQEIEATYLEETLGERYGAIVFLHDQGEQFESQGVVTPLRHALPEYGWSTLTLALDYPFEANILLSPVDELTDAETDDSNQANNDEETSSEAKTTDIQPLPPISNQQRIEAAVEFLQAKDVQRIIFIGHGVGGDMAIELLDSITTPISALILVGATAFPENDVFNEFNFPVFDVYGSNDLDIVPTAVKHRATLMKRNSNTRYESRRVIGADHVFSGLQPTLTAIISAWLRKKFIKQDDN